MDAVILAVQAWLVSGIALVDAIFIIRRLRQRHMFRRQNDKFNSDWFLLSIRMAGALIVSVAYALTLLRWMPFQLAAEIIQSGLVIILTFSLLRDMLE